MSDLDEVVQEFLVESYENLDQLERDLLELEEHPGSVETLSSVFRTVHTIKGTCGFLGFGKLESVAHVGENMLSKLRDKALLMNPEMASALLALSDALREMLSAIEATGAEGHQDYTTLIELLSRLNDGRPAGEPVVADAVPTAPVVAEPVVAEPVVAEPVVAEPVVAEPVVAGPVQAEGGPAEVAPVEAAAMPETVEGSLLGEILIAKHAVAPAVVAEALEIQADTRAGSVAETSIRVDVGLLDNLMTLVGELVLARNQIVQLVAGQQDSTMGAVSQRLNLITTELQEGAMKTRMQPIGNLWSKLPRVVRDLSVACGKRVRLEMEGEDTELDKTIIEAIKDPLTHLVRNAVDHGIETPEAREALGKRAEGRLLIRAFHEGGQVNIEITDDGGGIDPEKIREKATAKGFIPAARAAAMNERELLDLIFAPGFSTAAQVTNVSGRGVGMDVVRTNIEKIGGTVDVQSQPGEGTLLRIRIPLTLAIIPALIITSGGQRYAIPQISLLELVRLEGHEAGVAIELIQGTPVYRLRGRLLPLVYLHRELELEAPEPGGPINIVVLQADDRHFGLVVEGVRDTAEIVVKPLGHHLKAVPTFAGATIMGDGRVGLILDVMGLAQRARVLGSETERATEERAALASEVDADCETLLLFATPDDGRMAIPLAAVDRLEEFTLSATELTGDQQVVQYRGEIMPLVHISSILPERRATMRYDEDEATSDSLQVVVHRMGERRVGLVVGRIQDIVEERLELAPASRSCVLGSVVVHGRVTEVIDLPAVLAAAGINESSLLAAAAW